MEGRHLNELPKQPHLASFYMQEQWLYSEILLDVLTPHPISMSKPSHPKGKTNFRQLYS